MSAEWRCIRCNQDECRRYLDQFKVFDHPLKQSTITMLDSDSNCGSSSTISLDPLSLALDGSDPLSQFARQDSAQDPLSQMAAEFDGALNMSSGAKSKKKEDTTLLELDLIEPWAGRRGPILNKYTTNEKLSIVTSFLNGGETIKSQTTMAEKVKHRLEQLVEFEEGSLEQFLKEPI